MTDPISHNRARVTWGGGLGTADSWSVGVGIAFETAPTSGVDLDLWLSSLETAFLNWWSAGTPNVGGVQAVDTTLLQARAYAYVGGSRSAYAVGEHTFAAPNATQTAKCPLQTACVATLRSDAAGRSSRGRIYVPATGAILGTHQFSGSDVDDIATSTANLLHAINTSTQNGGGVKAVIVGKLYPFQVITQVIVDSKPDSQRPRSRKAHALAKGVALVT